VQILLNTFAFGCAGFNTVLGPARPTFVALTIVAQGSSWYVASSRPYQWKTTASMTLVSVGLTLLPEALAWRTAQRAGPRRAVPAGGHPRDLDGDGTIHLRLQLSTMGCSSCVATVSQVLGDIEGVLRQTVSLEDGSADIFFDEAVTRRRIGSGAGKGSMNDLLRKDVADQLQAAGFPVDACGPDKRTHASN
jgi:copper chaperone CopZ